MVDPTPPEISVGPAGIQIRSTAPTRFDGPGPNSALRPALPTSLRSTSRQARRLLAVGCVLIGLLVGSAGVSVISALGLPTVLFAPLGLLVLILSGIAAVLWRSASKVVLDPVLEAQILELAASDHGHLTVARTAHRLGISLAEADDALSTLARAGHLDVDISTSGTVLYVIRDFAQVLPPSQPEKTS